ncbi:hypothetical protein QBC46DRAFT_417889 [Diplogelasinospora grovesii]|uniref:Uncharacterized protein n=1 Tax=Diplogelasinospora grovesii TaxID=303347 RepID=A0AAN6S7D3_9PEZI|nr:hypothetical protein QBC46DRAFT_417889 [Diplogelasinospora grovesii]
MYTQHADAKYEKAHFFSGPSGLNHWAAIHGTVPCRFREWALGTPALQNETYPHLGWYQDQSSDKDRATAPVLDFVPSNKSGPCTVRGVLAHSETQQLRANLKGLAWLGVKGAAMVAPAWLLPLALVVHHCAAWRVLASAWCWKPLGLDEQTTPQKDAQQKTRDPDVFPLLCDFVSSCVSSAQPFSDCLMFSVYALTACLSLPRQLNEVVNSPALYIFARFCHIHSKLPQPLSTRSCNPVLAATNNQDQFASLLPDSNSAVGFLLLSDVA